jgi:hypothetical protein
MVVTVSANFVITDTNIDMISLSVRRVLGVIEYQLLDPMYSCIRLMVTLPDVFVKKMALLSKQFSRHLRFVIRKSSRNTKYVPFNKCLKFRLRKFTVAFDFVEN